MKQFLITFLVLTGGFAMAEQPWTMARETTITIDKYDPTTKTYELTYLEYPAQGPLITTAKDLAKAIKAIDLKRAQRDPASILESQYTTDRELRLYLPEEVDAMKATVAKAKTKPKGK